MYCVECHLRIYEQNFFNGNPTEDTATICIDCVSRGVHLRCMNASDREEWDFDHEWMCNSCLDEPYYDSELSSE